MVVIFVDKSTDNGFGYATQQQPQQQQPIAYAAGSEFAEDQSFATHYHAQHYHASHHHQQQPHQRYSAPRHYGGGDQHHGSHHHRYLLAERYKTKTCRNHMMTGACPYGHRCMFAHGVHELRTTDMNVRDGLMTEEAIRSFQRAMTAYNRGELAQMMSQDSFVYSSGVAPYTAPLTHDAVGGAVATSAGCECANCAAAHATHNPYYAAMPPATALGHPTPAPVQQQA